MTHTTEAGPNHANRDSSQRIELIRRWWPLTMMLVCSLLSYMDRQILTVLSPMILADLKLNVEKYGEIVRAFSVAYMLGNPI
jgi:MFS transporter, ACS family, hexuronate transporter